MVRERGGEYVGHLTLVNNSYSCSPLPPPKLASVYFPDNSIVDVFY